MRRLLKHPLISLEHHLYTTDYRLSALTFTKCTNTHYSLYIHPLLHSSSDGDQVFQTFHCSHRWRWFGRFLFLFFFFFLSFFFLKVYPLLLKLFRLKPTLLFWKKMPSSVSCFIHFSYPFSDLEEILLLQVLVGSILLLI